MSNANTVRSIYEAFGRGDLNAILEHMSESVDWDYAYESSQIPYLAHRKGREGVAAFFQALGGAVDLTKFAPHTLVEGPGVVVVLVDAELVVKATGKRIVEKDETHVWHFDKSGRVARFRHCADTAQHLAALRP